MTITQTSFNLSDTREKCNGWADYTTWNCALWIGGDESFYNIARECRDYIEFLNEMQMIHIQKGVSEEGYPMLGDPDAPVSVVEYSSFSCPTCAEVHDNAFPGILERVEAGQASVTYVPLPVAGRNVEGANRAAICMQEQGLFWEYHDTLFSWAQQFGNSPFTQNRLTAGAEALGADTAAFNSCVTDGETQFLLDSANSQAASQGIQSTPTLLVNGTRVDDISTNGILGAIDTAYAPFAGQEPEVEPTAEEVEPTAEEMEPTPEEAEPTAEDAEPTAEETEPTAEATESSD